MVVLNGKRIFYVEDDVKNRAIAQMILEQAGATVGFERWGREDTLTKLRAFLPIDLILLDLMFPNNVTGYDIFDAIQRDLTLASIPIVAISASDPTIEIPRARQKGFKGFISKPINLKQFPLQIAGYMRGENLWYTD
jgi:CheY-like chemotaxis protein